MKEDKEVKSRPLEDQLSSLGQGSWEKAGLLFYYGCGLKSPEDHKFCLFSCLVTVTRFIDIIF